MYSDIRDIDIERITYEEINGFAFPSKRGKGLKSIIYHIDGLLIDTGHKHARSDILRSVKSLRVDQMLITHHHEDHSANIDVIQKLFSCPVKGSPLCSQMMKTRREDIGFARKRSWGVSPIYEDIEPVEELIKTKHYAFQIIPVPGHASDMIALYEPSRKWLFTADAYLSSFIGYFMREEGMAQQIHSLRRLLELDFDAVLCSHHPVWSGGKEKIKKKLDYFERTFASIKSLYEKGYSQRAIRQALGMKEYWDVRLLSQGHLSAKNMINAVIREVNSGVSI